MADDLDEVAARQSRLRAAVAELAELSFDDLPAEVLDSVLCSVESAQSMLSTAGYDAINGLGAQWRSRSGRLRDHLASLLHVSPRRPARASPPTPT